MAGQYRNEISSMAIIELPVGDTYKEAMSEYVNNIPGNLQELFTKFFSFLVVFSSLSIPEIFIKQAKSKACIILFYRGRLRTPGSNFNGKLIA